MSERLLPYFALCMALMVFAAACRDAHPRATENDQQSRAAESFEDSGRRLSGDFVVESFSDDYLVKAVQDGTPSAFSFKDDGTFRSERKSRGVGSIEGGSYLITVHDEIVLYIETGGGERLSTARLELYKIEAQSEAELRLRQNASTTLLLRRK
jgi:hypothetical protein